MHFSKKEKPLLKKGQSSPKSSKVPPNIADCGFPPGPLGTHLPRDVFGRKCGEFYSQNRIYINFPLFFGSLMSSALAAAAAAVTIFAAPERRRRRGKLFKLSRPWIKGFFPPTSPSGLQPHRPLPCQRASGVTPPPDYFLFYFLLLFFLSGVLSRGWAAQTFFLLLSPPRLLLPPPASPNLNNPDISPAKRLSAAPDPGRTHRGALTSPTPARPPPLHRPRNF